MNHYELMAIIVPDLDEKAAADYAENGIVKRIKDLGGKTTFQDFWGARGFAYKIDGQKWGYYFVARFDLSPEKTIELRKDMNIDAKIVRQMITKVEEGTPEPKKYADLKREYEAQEKKNAEKKTEGETIAEVKKEKLTTIDTPSSKKPKSDLDKVLDNVVGDL